MKKLLFILASAALLAGCANSESDNQQVLPAKQTLTVTSDSCTVEFRFPAQLKGVQDVDIVPQVSATLEQLLVSEGEDVKKGQKIFILNQTEFLAVLNNAKAKVQSAYAQVKTMELEVSAQKELMDKNIVSEHQYKVTYNDYLRAKAELAEAKAAELHAQNDYDHTTLCAPFDGIVGNIAYRKGALVGPQMAKPITVVSDNRSVVAYSSINEFQYMNLARHFGSRDKILEKVPACKLEFNDGTTYDKEGKIITLSGVIDRETGAISVRTLYPNPNGILSSGGSATVVLPVTENAIIIPKNATYSLQDKTFAYLAEKKDSVYAATPVELVVERYNDTEYLVYSGLKDGDVIVTEGVSKMYSGMEFTIKEQK